MANTRYRFRDFRLDPAARELWRGEVLQVLPGSAFDCLIHLIEHRERAVGRDELIAAVWGRAEVADSLLAQTVLRVRRTLGDAGSEGAIRTVARFGYRWVEPVEIEVQAEAEVAAPGSAPALADVPATRELPERTDVPPATFQSESAHADTMPTGASSRRSGSTRIAIVAASLLLIALGLWWWWRPTAAVIPEAATTAATSDAPALVLPATVTAAAGWEWLRLGLMDLIGNRLREGGLATAPSETVLALLDGGTADTLAAVPAARDALRIAPVVLFDNDRWRVRLTVQRGNEAAQDIEAEADDVLRAARSAADLLLIRLGRTPPDGGAEPRPVALEALLQRTRTAILSDQFDLAVHLIDAAPPALREAPEIELRLAQIDQGRGEYIPAAQRLQALLDRVAASTQPALRGRILLALGTSLFQRGELDAARASFDDAIATLAQANDPIALGGAYGSRAAVASQQEDYDAAVADLGRARVEMDAGGDALGLAQVDVSLGLTHIRNNRPALGLPLLQEAEARIAALGAREELAYARFTQVGAELQLLDNAAAGATVAAFWPAEAHTANARLRWQLTQARVFLLLAVGELTEAEVQLAHIERDASPTDDADVRAAGRALAAVVLAERGRDDAAAAMAAGAAMTPELARNQPDLYLTAWWWRLRALRSSGQLALAHEETVALQRWVETHANPWRRIHAKLAQAEQTRADAGAEAALPAFADAFEQARRLGIPEDMTVVAEPYVRALLESDRLDDAATVVGSVAGWAAQDARAAWSQALLYRAQRRIDAWERSAALALRLAGERRLPSAPID